MKIMVYEQLYLRKALGILEFNQQFCPEPSGINPGVEQPLVNDPVFRRYAALYSPILSEYLRIHLEKHGEIMGQSNVSV